MENNKSDQEKENIAAQLVENNYDKHKTNPGPSAEAVKEDNDKGGGLALKWILPILIIILAIFFLFIFNQ